MHGKGLLKEPSLLLGRLLGRIVLSNMILRRLRQYPVKPIINKIRKLDVDSNDIDELVEEHNQELTTVELKKFHCVSQQEVMEESLSEEE
ncbi:hypothetical protein AVEN_124349-1 [Araneus ventricosus]|uniref:Uncharacterized protein n=1 Tax=Araneus ventricosus TaxID=182803 RepID=A0A4Y2PLE8_ARAVE|nr:hypothetical protein AVEN_124349-1 [Araneus ventricosus]